MDSLAGFAGAQHAQEHWGVIFDTDRGGWHRLTRRVLHMKAQIVGAIGGLFTQSPDWAADGDMLQCYAAWCTVLCWGGVGTAACADGTQTGACGATHLDAGFQLSRDQSDSSFLTGSLTFRFSQQNIHMCHDAIAACRTLSALPM